MSDLVSNSSAPHALPSDLTRELGAYEHLLWAIDRREPQHFVVVVRVDGPHIPEHALRAALASAQRRHPALRARIVWSPGEAPRFAATDEPIALRTLHGCPEEWRTVAARELSEPVDLEVGPMVRVTLLNCSDVSYLILTVHHAIGDGVSTLYLAQDILAHETAASITALPAHAGFDELVLQATERPTPYKVEPRHLDSARLRPPVISTFELAPDDLEALVARCRDERTTLYGALTAAALLVLDEPSPRCLVPINARRHLPGIDKDFGVYSISTIVSIDTRESTPFWEAARRIRAQIVAHGRRTCLPAIATAFRSMRASAHSDAELHQTLVSLKQEHGYHVMLTDVGRMPEIRGRRVSALYGLPNMEQVPTVAVFAADGRLFVTMASPADRTYLPWFKRFEALLRAAVTLELATTGTG